MKWIKNQSYKTSLTASCKPLDPASALYPPTWGLHLLTLRLTVPAGRLDIPFFLQHCHQPTSLSIQSLTSAIITFYTTRHNAIIISSTLSFTHTQERKSNCMTWRP